MKSKVLVLGSRSCGVKELLHAARVRGVYTIVTDDLPLEQSPTKKIADEYWMISTADVDLLEKRCLEESVDAIIAGISTFNISIMMELCCRLKLPCYCTPEAWSYTIDKRKFKDICQACGVPVARDYHLSLCPTEEEIGGIEFPVVVKAIDQSSNRGMSYCYSSDEIVAACDFARSMSNSETVIVEQMLKGMEYAAWYVLAEGEATLLSFGAMLSQPGYPGNCYSVTTTDTNKADLFHEEVNPYFVKALKEMGCNEGFAWVEMMLDEDGHFYVLEMGYRPSGDMIGIPFGDVYGFDVFGWLLDVSLGRKNTLAGLSLPTNPDGTAVSYILWSNNEGVISSIEGLDKVSQIPAVNVELIAGVGSRVEKHQYLVVITFCGEDLDCVCKTIAEINELVTIRDEQGESLVIYYDDYATLKRIHDEGAAELRLF